MKKLISIIIIFLFFVIAGCTPSVDNGEFVITLEFNDGSVPTLIYIEEGENLNNLIDKTREGHDFGGYYLDPEFTNVFDPETAIYEDITIYYKWIPYEYTIKLAGNGGTHLPSVILKYNESLEITEKPIRDGYNFTGWYTDTLSKHKYNFSQKITNNFTLYAGWERKRLPLVELEEYEVKYIVTSPGEDASTMININYQNKTKKSFVEYTLADDNYNSKKIAYPTGFGFEGTDLSFEKPFEFRNINKVNIKNLTPNANYKYRINKGNNTYSEDYYFTTAGGEDTTSFLFISDAHYYDGYDGAEIVETTIASALEIQPQIDFIYSTGDMVDRGGNADQWDKLFTMSGSFKSLPFLAIPGNHEHSRTAGTKNDVSHAYFNFPENSFDEYLGASYYFIHNDTLFLQIDTDSTYRRTDVYKWIDDVLTENKTKFVIVGTHAPFHLGSKETNVDYKRPLLDIMEKHSVDLVLSGHYHSHNIQTLFQDEKPINEFLGVNYLNGWAAGIKSIGTNLPEEFARGYIVDVLGDSIKVRYINARGDILGTFTFDNLKLSPIEIANEHVLADSIAITFDNDNSDLTFSWDKKFYGNVEKVVIKETKYNKHYVELPIPTPGYTSYTFNNFTENDYEFVFEFHMKNDGAIVRKNFNLSIDIFDNK